ncbi:MAG TPA: hypothetical protein VMF87_00065 [Streptosporangiaceae bacterium]|nr:hypothetical protein [Streptosporangiaceae bacterium]
MPDSYPASHSADNADDVRRAQAAVQIALDRRDNGGDAGLARD